MRFPRSTGRGCGVDTPTSVTKNAGNPFEASGIIADADREGIDVMVAYPSLGIGATAFADLPFAEDFCRRWNRWAARFAAGAPGRRLRVIGIVPLQDPERAVRTLDLAGELGMAGVTVPPALCDGRNLDHPTLEPFWAAVETSGLPVGIHGAPGMNVPVAGADRFDNYVQVHALSFPFDQMIGLTALALGGVFERHPALSVAFLEAGVGWAPYFLERLDEHVEKRGHQVPECRRPPSEYAARGQCVFTCEPEERGLEHAVEALGADKIMYASDYPHWDSDFPRTVAPIRDRPTLSDATKAAVLGGTAARFYGV
jgi:predicted TIM-barrel fold metal-dependent hydrolase